MNIRRSLNGVAGALGAAALGVSALTGVSAADAASDSVADVTAAAPVAQGYVPGSKDDANNAALRASLEQAVAAQSQLSSQAPGVAAAAATIVYDDSQAPSFAGEISTAVSIWNSSVSNVQFVEGSGATLDFYEGDDPSGSYAYSDGRGNGYVFFDYAQTEVYDVQRVVTHEIGHTIGLPDTYDGPCSQLMSGGGPGPSCTNTYPDASEVAQVDAIWAGSAAASPLAAAFR